MTILQDLPLDILLEIARLHPWVACELAKTIRKVGLYSIENDVKIWFKLEENKETFILIKSSKEPYYVKLYHSWNDNPASIGSNGDEWWFKKGNLHRDDDLPSIIYHSDGIQYWYKDDKVHREADLPAVIFSDGMKYWCKDGNYHRDGDLPAIIYSNGGQYWYKEGMIHREADKPAVIWYDGEQHWYKEGRRYFPQINILNE